MVSPESPSKRRRKRRWRSNAGYTSAAHRVRSNCSAMRLRYHQLCSLWFHRIYIETWQVNTARFPVPRGRNERWSRGGRWWSVVLQASGMAIEFWAERSPGWQSNSERSEVRDTYAYAPTARSVASQSLSAVDWRWPADRATQIAGARRATKKIRSIKKHDPTTTLAKYTQHHYGRVGCIWLRAAYVRSVWSRRQGGRGQTT